MIKKKLKAPISPTHLNVAEAAEEVAAEDAAVEAKRAVAEKVPAPRTSKDGTAGVDVVVDKDEENHREENRFKLIQPIVEEVRPPQRGSQKTKQKGRLPIKPTQLGLEIAESVTSLNVRPLSPFSVNSSVRLG